jgi:hypothetical protein
MNIWMPERIDPMKWLGAVALVATLLFAASNLWHPYSNRFRVTIEVDTPNGIKSGSSVLETDVFESGCWGPVEACGLRRKAKGEAIFVDLGNGRNLVGILGWGEAGSDESGVFDLTRAALAPGTNLNWKEEQKLKGRGDLPSQNIPTLITFDDLTNPATAKVVDPTNLALTFGPGYSLRRVTLETTSAPLNYAIEAKLPWWSSPGRPASIARRAWSNGRTDGPSLASEDLFRKE